MKIGIIENLINNIEDKNIVSIIELLIESVRDYPLNELDDIELYFREIKKLTGSNKINSVLINDYIKNNKNTDNENNIWIMTSLSSLLDALDLMNLYKISYEDIQDKINSIAFRN